MTQKMLHTRLYSVCGVLLLLLIAGSVLGWCMSRDALPFLALSPLVVSVPAAYLAHCFQQRALFVNSLRKLWSDAVKAKGLLVRYCLSAGQTDYYEAWTGLSNVVDEVRAVYRNIDETDQQVGTRSFEPLMDMLREFEQLEPSAKAPPPFAQVQTNVDASWKAFQDAFLEEFDRPKPSSFITEKGVQRPEYGQKASVERLPQGSS